MIFHLRENTTPSEKMLLNLIYKSLYYVSPLLNRHLGQVEPDAESKITGLLAFADGSNWNPDGNGTAGVFYWNGSVWKLLLPVTAATALTAQSTAITFTAPGTPDYALQDVTNSSPYGFVDAEELRTFISVVSNLQTRVAELEDRLKNSHHLIA